MIANQAAQQIANLLVQAGVPSPHSMDVAQRLLAMSNAAPAAAPGSRSFDSQSANNSDFYNRFKSDEERAKDGAAGKAGKDGLPGYGGSGVDGRDGMPGIPGEPGTIDWDSIRALIAAMIAEALSAFLANLLNNVLTCRWFKKKFQDCLDVGPGGNDLSSCPKCCKQHGPILKGTDVCWQLMMHAYSLRDLKKRVTKIEQDLKNTTDCEA